ncbi:MAG: hypothetical protein GKS03_15045 [Alphaproteobacteria bacterium]|nr:hypothetical protein [Alphaproteobacteria bacterium]
MNVGSIGTSALLAAQQTVHIRANNIVNAQTEGFKPAAPALVSAPATGGVAVFAQETNGPVNLVEEAAGLITASVQYEAAAALIRTDEELSKTLLDITG